MRKLKIFALLLALASLFTACSGNSGPIKIDKNKKAIVTTDGSSIRKLIIDGGGEEVTFQSYGDPKGNSVIYFNSHNPGFLVSEGFGLNKDYFLTLKAHSRYSVSYYKSENEQPYTVFFKTDYNGNIIDDPDKD